MASGKKALQMRSSEPKGSLKEVPKSVDSPNVPWFEGCEYKCKIPGCPSVYFHEDGFVDHLESVHEGLVGYIKSYPGDFFTKTVTLTCQICQTEVVRRHPSLSHHFSHHGYTMERYRQKFNIPDMYNPQDEKGKEFTLGSSSSPIQYSCHQCPNFLTTSEAILRHHFESLHHGSKAMCKIPKTDKSLECQICKDKVIKNNEPIAVHFEKECLQKMSPFSYFKNHVDGKEEVGLNEVTTREINKEAEKWAIGTNFKCLICSKLKAPVQPFNSRQLLTKHLERAHSKSLDEYANSLEINLCDLERIKCQLCGVSINHTYSDIRSHLRLSHDLEISKYYEKYVKAETKDSKTRKLSDGSSSCAEEPPYKSPRISGISNSGTDTAESISVDADAEIIVDFPCDRGNVISSMETAPEKSPDEKASDWANSKGPGRNPKKHTCRICHRNIKHKEPLLKQHLEAQHQMLLVKYFMDFINKFTKKKSKGATASEDYEGMNGCVFHCQICSLAFRDKTKFCSHIDTAHDGMTYLKYRTTIGDPFLSLKLMQCQECKAVLIHEKQEILDHLSQGHSITPEEYLKILKNR